MRADRTWVIPSRCRPMLRNVGHLPWHDPVAIIIPKHRAASDFRCVQPRLKCGHRAEFRPGTADGYLSAFTSLVRLASADRNHQSRLIELQVGEIERGQLASPH